MAAKRQPVWQAGAVRALRQHLGLTQAGLSAELGVRQQTVSEWETGAYQPRGATVRLLSLVAERAGFTYDSSDEPDLAASEGVITPSRPSPQQPDGD